MAPAKKKAAKATDEKRFLLTQEGYDNLVTELEQLKTTERKKVSDRLAEAISYGDLSENSEYDEAKNQQAFIEARIIELEDQIKYADIVEADKNDGTIQVGSTVTLKALDTGDVAEYYIVGSTEADPLNNKISNESPVGEAIVGMKAKKQVKVKAPGGEYEYEIVKVG